MNMRLQTLFLFFYFLATLQPVLSQDSLRIQLADSTLKKAWQISNEQALEAITLFEEAMQIHYHLENTYKKFGYNLVEVPFGIVEDRVDFILNSIKNG